jgi:caa(3)-type oxidase subunit IV
MAEGVEQIEKYKRTFWKIGMWLCVFTVITVALAYVEFKSHSMNILIGMIIATFKASLVALIFMHLKDEKKLIYKVLFFTVILVIALFTLFIVAYHSNIIYSGF